MKIRFLEANFDKVLMNLINSLEEEERRLEGYEKDTN